MNIWRLIPLLYKPLDSTPKSRKPKITKHLITTQLLQEINTKVRDFFLVQRSKIAVMTDNGWMPSKCQLTQSTSEKATPITHEVQRTSFQLLVFKSALSWCHHIQFILHVLFASFLLCSCRNLQRNRTS